MTDRELGTNPRCSLPLLWGFLFSSMNKLKFDDQHIVVKGWMASKLKLTGNKLTAYALIYGFSQDGESEFKGSISYIQKWLGCSRPTVVSVINNLLNEGLIKKRKTKVNGKNRSFYSSNLDQLKNFTSKETLPITSKETLPITSKETLPNNIIYSNIEDNIKGEQAPKAVSSTNKNKDTFKPPVREELGKFLHSYMTGHVRKVFEPVKNKNYWAVQLADDILDFYGEKDWRQTNGKKIEDWKRAAQGWATRALKNGELFKLPINHPDFGKKPWELNQGEALNGKAPSGFVSPLKSSLNGN